MVRQVYWGIWKCHAEMAWGTSGVVVAQMACSGATSRAAVNLKVCVEGGGGEELSAVSVLLLVIVSGWLG